MHVIAGEDLDKETIPKKTIRIAERAEPFDARPYGFALLAVAVATSVSALLWPWIGTENTDLVYLTAVVGVAVRFGLWPSLLASAASALCYNFFFTAPYYTLPSPIRGTSSLSCFSPSWRWWCPMSRRGRERLP